MKYVMSKRMYRYYRNHKNLKDQELLVYINLNFGLRGTITELQISG